MRYVSSQPARLNLPRSEPLVVSLLHDVDRHVAQDREIVGSVAQPGPVLILVHDDIQPPVQPVFDAPVLTDDLVEAFSGQRLLSR